MKKVFFFMIPLMVLAGCQGTDKGAAQKVPAVDLADLDTSVAPGQDFYQYSTGGWQKNNPLKPEYARYGAFDIVGENNQIQLNDLFESMTTMKTKKGSVEQKIVDLYKQGLDTTRRNAEGAAPLKKYLDQIYSVSDKAGLVKTIAQLHDAGEGSFFGAYVEADLMDSNNQILYLNQGGLGIGDRDYYTEAENAALKEGYRQFLCKVFALAGIENAENAADNALCVEDALALVSWTSVQNRDVEAGYNPMSAEQIIASYPGFDFALYGITRGVGNQSKIIVGQPSFFEGFSNIFQNTQLDVLKDYVAAQLISGACSALSDDFYTAYFDFFSRQMAGVTEQKPLWKRAMSVPNSILGEAVGKMYVEKYFPESSKQRVAQLVENLKVALGQHIDALEWMGEETKAYAHEKLSNFHVKVGYPDKWKDYSSLEIDPELSYYENLRAASAWSVKENKDKMGKPTDKEEWGMSPQTVNAYYNPTTNEICFPAAILQPPFFNADADDAVNYGAIGVVIGHEMTHGFDDQGRLFDKDGNMTNWWTPADDEAFRARAEVLAAQYDEIEVLPGLHANGHLSLGENIADHGGLSVAYSALLNSFGENHPEPVDGFTAEQRFYLGYAKVWASNATDAEKARRTKMDVHSLPENRVNVAVRNFQTFFDAFGIKEGDAMYRPESERVRIW